MLSGSTMRTSTTRSPGAAGGTRKAAPGDPERSAALRAGRQVDAGHAVERRHFDPRAEHRFMHGDRHGAEQVVAVTAEQRVRQRPARDVEIAGVAATHAGVPLPGNPQPSRHPACRRHPHVDRFGRAPRVPDRRRPRRRRALPPCPRAGRAALREHHVAARPARLAAPFAAACSGLPSCRAGRRRGTRRMAPVGSPPPAARRRSAAPRTARPASRAGRRPASARPAPGAGTGFSTSANSSLKVEACAPSARTEKSNAVNCGTSGRTAGAGAARRVVGLTPPRIGQDLVGLGDPREGLLGGAVTRVDPRVIPPRQPAIRALDVGGARIRLTPRMT